MFTTILSQINNKWADLDEIQRKIEGIKQLVSLEFTSPAGFTATKIEKRMQQVMNFRYLNNNDELMQLSNHYNHRTKVLNGLVQLGEFYNLISDINSETNNLDSYLEEIQNVMEMMIKKVIAWKKLDKHVYN